MQSSSFPKILGTTSLNDKGQIVIPADARHHLGLAAGSRVVIMSSSHRPALMLFKAEDVEVMVNDFADALGQDGTSKKEPEN